MNKSSISIEFWTVSDQSVVSQWSVSSVSNIQYYFLPNTKCLLKLVAASWNWTYYALFRPLLEKYIMLNVLKKCMVIYWSAPEVTLWVIYLFGLYLWCPIYVAPIPPSGGNQGFNLSQQPPANNPVYLLSPVQTPPEGPNSVSARSEAKQHACDVWPLGYQLTFPLSKRQNLHEKNTIVYSSGNHQNLT